MFWPSGRAFLGHLYDNELFAGPGQFFCPCRRCLTGLETFPIQPDEAVPFNMEMAVRRDSV
jgi:hypothetical protein